MQDIIQPHRLLLDQDTALRLPERATVALVGAVGPQGTPHLWVRQPHAPGERVETVTRVFRVVQAGYPFPRGARLVGACTFGALIRIVLELPR